MTKFLKYQYSARRKVPEKSVLFLEYPNFLKTQKKQKNPVPKIQMDVFSRFYRTPTCDGHRHTESHRAIALVLALAQRCTGKINRVAEGASAKGASRFVAEGVSSE